MCAADPEKLELVTERAKMAASRRLADRDAWAATAAPGRYHARRVWICASDFATDIRHRHPPPTLSSYGQLFY